MAPGLGLKLYFQLYFQLYFKPYFSACSNSLQRELFGYVDLYSPASACMIVFFLRFPARRQPAEVSTWISATRSDP
jgi:hypothetical protein